MVSMLNRTFVTKRGNLARVFVSKSVGRVNGMAGLGAVRRTWVVVGDRSFDLAASFKADAVVDAAGL